MLQILLITIIILGIVFLAFGIKLLFNRKAKITIRSCSSTVTGESCACGHGCSNGKNDLLNN